MKTFGFVVGVAAIIAAIVAIQAGVVMVASAFLATELGIGAALSYGSSLVAAVIIDLLQIVFAKPKVKATTE